MNLSWTNSLDFWQQLAMPLIGSPWTRELKEVIADFSRAEIARWLGMSSDEFAKVPHSEVKEAVCSIVPVLYRNKKALNANIKILKELKELDVLKELYESKHSIDKLKHAISSVVTSPHIRRKEFVEIIKSNERKLRPQLKNISKSTLSNEIKFRQSSKLANSNIDKLLENIENIYKIVEAFTTSLEQLL